MKILTGIDVPFRPFGGSLLVCDDWYSNLPSDVEVRFLTLPNPDGVHWWHMQDVVMMDIEKTRTREGFAEYVRRLREVVEAQIADFKPDIIHSQHLNYGLARAIAELDTDIPRVGICHGTDVQAASRDDFFLENMAYICDHMDMLLFSTPSMHDDFTVFYPKEKEHQICPLGIPEAYFDQAPRPLHFDGQGTMRALYAGRLLDWKGADIAVDALTQVHHEVQLTVIGNEDQAGYRQRMQDTIAAHHLREKVTFRPQLPREELLKSFADYDLIVFPSRQFEAFSLTVVEAQAKGLPVIYHPGGGIADTVGGSGIAMASPDPTALAELLDAVYEHPDMLVSAQAKGYRNAQKYTLENSRAQLFALSKQLIDRRRAS